MGLLGLSGGEMLCGGTVSMSWLIGEKCVCALGIGEWRPYGGAEECNG